MIPFWWIFIAMFIGFVLGVVVICALAIGGRADDDYKRLWLEDENRKLKAALEQFTEKVAASDVNQARMNEPSP